MRIKFKSTRLHVALALVWVALMYPTVAYWSESVLWVGLMSCYALFIGHISSYEAAASAGVDQETHDKLNAIADGLADLMEVLPDLVPEGPSRDEFVTKLNRHSGELRHVVGLEDSEQGS